ncbi:hypothetical protein ON010_g15523 [Phytophthora cinnamomi]|nr:hypothetical protein ON010_g15523 [Phytophthora cinnamomi]
MIIDLTNTFKYYNGYEEFEDSGVHYVKLRIEGFNGPPAAKDVAKFMEIVDEFVEKEPEGAIAVHCTHGLNRTGYLIVNYLVERMDLTVTQALEAFKVARPPGLIKHMYVEELYQRLGKEEEEVQLPELPDWASAKYGKRAKDGKRGGHGDRGKREGSSRHGNRDMRDGGKHDSRDRRENRGNADGEGGRHDRGSKHGRRDGPGKRDSRDSRENAADRDEGEQKDRRNTHRGSGKCSNRDSRGDVDARESSKSERGRDEKDEKHSTHLRFEAEVG